VHDAALQQITELAAVLNQSLGQALSHQQVVTQGRVTTGLAKVKAPAGT
jgi:hypothetical protein